MITEAKIEQYHAENQKNNKKKDVHLPQLEDQYRTNSLQQSPKIGKPLTPASKIVSKSVA